MWLLCGVLIFLACLAAVCLFAVWPGRCPKALRAPFAGRNYAHRGLFAPDQSVPENSLPAFDAAAGAGYGIELDVQFTKDRQLVVFHDDTVDRMTGAHGFVQDLTLAQLAALPLQKSGEHAPTFAQVLGVVAGRVPLIVEIKSRREFSGAYLDELCRAVIAELAAYGKATGGAYCIESFDPRVVHRVRRFAPGVLRGQLADCPAGYRGDGANRVYAFLMSRCFGNFLGRPQFLAWCPAPRNFFVRLIARLGAMMVYWTALPEHDAAALQGQNDAVIFQWYRPAPRY